MESPSELSSVLSDVSNLSSFPGAEKKGDRSMTNYDYENKRLAGIRAMQIRPTPGTFRLPNNSWSGYGLSHTSPAAVLREKTGNKKVFNVNDFNILDVTDRCLQSDDVWTSPSKSNDGYGLPSTSSSALNTSNLLDQTPSHIIQRVTSTKWSDLPSMLTSLGLERYIGLFATHEIDLGTFVSLNDQDLVEIGINAFGARRKMLLAISGKYLKRLALFWRL